MSIDVLGASHLADQGFEVQRSNNFEIQVDVGNESKSRILTLAVVSGFLPSESNEVIQLNYGNTQVSVAGAARPNNNGSLVVRDFLQEGSDVEAIIDAWRDSVYAKSDRYGRRKDAIGFAFDYKKTAKITQCAPDGTHIRVWNVKGVWPSAVDYGQVSYDSPGVKTINITLQYDLCELDRSDYSRSV